MMDAALRKACKAFIDAMKHEMTLLPDPRQPPWHSIREDELLEELMAFAHPLRQLADDRLACEIKQSAIIGELKEQLDAAETERIEWVKRGERAEQQLASALESKEYYRTEQQEYAKDLRVTRQQLAEAQATIAKSKQ